MIYLNDLSPGLVLMLIYVALIFLGLPNACQAPLLSPSLVTLPLMVSHLLLGRGAAAVGTYSLLVCVFFLLSIFIPFIIFNFLLFVIGTGHPAAAVSSAACSSRPYSPSDPYFGGPSEEVSEEEDEEEYEEEYEEDENNAASHYDCCAGDVDWDTHRQ